MTLRRRRSRKAGKIPGGRKDTPRVPAGAVSVEIPEALRSWRAAGEGRIVAVGRAGVTLYPGVAAKPLRFRTVDAAVRAVG